MSRSRGWRVAAQLTGGAVGAAATGTAVGVALRRSRLAAQRRIGHDQLAELGTRPAGTPCSVTADDGVRLSCEVIEPAGKRPAELTAVLVHGFAVDRRCWHFQRRGLAELAAPRTRVVLYDHRSHGRSERADPASCTLDQLGDDLYAVLRALVPTGPVALIGHSMGGMTIIALAERHPELFGERVGGVALVSTSAGEVASGGLPHTFLTRLNLVTRAVGGLARRQPRLVERARSLAADLIWGVTRAYAYGDRAVQPWLVDLVHTMISTNGVDALVDFTDTLGSHDRVAALSALARCETLIASGEADRLIPFRHTEVIAAELPDATLMRLPGVGHMAMLEAPELVDPELAALLATVACRNRGGGRRHRKRA